MSSTKRNLVLAFDIERSGAFDDNHTIAIGASVLDDNFVELDSLLLLGYVPGEVKFEERCLNEFWSKMPTLLERLTYTGPLTFLERQAEMIRTFHAFRAKWEDYAAENNCNLSLCCDNSVFDGGFINKMMFQYMPGTLPIPYSTKSKYSSFWETHSMQKGLLMHTDPKFMNVPWGLHISIASLYDVPQRQVLHDHNPANDAYTIAHELQVLYGICAGRITRRGSSDSDRHPMPLSNA